MVDSAAAQSQVAATSGRLAAALLGYFVLVTLVITMSPFAFSLRPFHLSLWVMPSDMIANVALFLPIGFLTRSLGNRSNRGLWCDVLLCAAFSLLIETTQIFISGRVVSPIDVASNTCGGFLGAWTRERVERWSMWRPQVVGRIGLDIPLVGLLYLLVPQLWLSGVGLVEDPRRSATVLLLGASGSIVMVALHRHRWQGGVGLAATAVPPLALAWFAIGALPTLAGAPEIFAALAVAVVGITAWLLRPRAEVRERRFEADTLGRFVPVFMLYLLVAALWPPMRGLAPWHGALGLPAGLTAAARADMLVLLEQVAGFTLLGYAAAEWRGRHELTLAGDLPRVTLTIAAFALALELVQGGLAGPGASLLRAFLATAGAVYGAAVYHLARTHVRVLRAVAPPRTIDDLERAA
jgi:glycopeptide antibiotics resistance protein